VKKPRKNLSFYIWTIDFRITTRCTYSLTEQNNKTTKNSSEKKGSANATSLEVSTISSNLNGVNHTPETRIGFEISKELGRPRGKRVLQKLADALNRCLCGLVLDSSLSGVIKCNQAGCETQWVSTHLMGTKSN
jgi:hypothetical protein